LLRRLYAVVRFIFFVSDEGEKRRDFPHQENPEVRCVLFST